MYIGFVMSSLAQHNGKTAEFYTSDGTIAFIRPFLFNHFDKKRDNENVCTALFQNLSDCGTNFKDDTQHYERAKQHLLTILHPKFPNADLYFNGISKILNGERVSQCTEEGHTYQGRNLCKCFSVCRKFHDDNSMYIPRIEIYLGSYQIDYNTNVADEHFSFTVDSLLLLSNEKDNECGYLIFTSSLDSIEQNLFENINPLDKLIFIKHLFYKSRLKCNISTNHDEYHHISIQHWADRYINLLIEQLEIHSSNAVNNYTLKNPENGEEGTAFSYSIIELNNIKAIGEENAEISIDSIETFKQQYVTQLYGLLVSDEGWRNVAKDEILPQFDNNHWASRKHTCSFFFGHSALVINQTDVQVNNAKQWFAKYHEFDSGNATTESCFYQDYVTIRPCIPGVKSLTLFPFMKAIYKKMMLERLRTYMNTSQDSPEEKYRRIVATLQNYSMLLDALHKVEDRISEQLAIPKELDELRERCQIEATGRITR